MTEIKKNGKKLIVSLSDNAKKKDINYLYLSLKEMQDFLIQKYDDFKPEHKL